jgi:hypothetical protein
VSPSEYLVDINRIFFNTWNIIFNDVEEYSTTWPWINDILGWKMDDKSNG